MGIQSAKPNSGHFHRQKKNYFLKKKRQQGQDGGVGRNPSLPRTTRRKTTNLKSINNKKCQKIKMHGTPTITELKKQSNRTTRPVRRRMERNLCEAVVCTGGCWLRWGGRLRGRGWLKGKLRLRGGCGLQRLLQWEKLPVSRGSSLKSALEMNRQAALFPLWPLPYRQRLSKEGCLAWINT